MITWVDDLGWKFGLTTWNDGFGWQLELTTWVDSLGWWVCMPTCFDDLSWRLVLLTWFYNMGWRLLLITVFDDLDWLWFYFCSLTLLLPGRTEVLFKNKQKIWIVINQICVKKLSKCSLAITMQWSPLVSDSFQVVVELTNNHRNLYHRIKL